MSFRFKAHLVNYFNLNSENIGKIKQKFLKSTSSLSKSSKGQSKKFQKISKSSHSKSHSKSSKSSHSSSSHKSNSKDTEACYIRKEKNSGSCQTYSRSGRGTYK